MDNKKIIHDYNETGSQPILNIINKNIDCDNKIDTNKIIILALTDIKNKLDKMDIDITTIKNKLYQYEIDPETDDFSAFNNDNNIDSTNDNINNDSNYINMKLMNYLNDFNNNLKILESTPQLESNQSQEQYSEQETDHELWIKSEIELVMEFDSHHIEPALEPELKQYLELGEKSYQTIQDFKKLIK